MIDLRKISAGKLDFLKAPRKEKQKSKKGTPKKHLNKQVLKTTTNSGGVQTNFNCVGVNWGGFERND